MRELKFRGKEADTGEWVVGQNIFFLYVDDKKEEKVCTMINANKPYSILKDGLVRYDPCIIDIETVGQYTGFIDKNGVEICEGDIVDGFNDGIAFVSYKKGGFVFELPDSWVNFQDLGGEVEVISNIHDKPELITWIQV